MSTPTPEFVKHIMAPERERFRRRLNEEWEPEVGDWCLVIRNGDGGWPDRKSVLLQHHRRVLWAQGVKDSDRVFWLPSLSQLLDMVEAEGLDYNCGKYEGEYSAAADQARPRCEELDWERVAEGRSLWGMEIAAASLLAALWGVE